MSAHPWKTEERPNSQPPGPQRQSASPDDLHVFTPAMWVGKRPPKQNWMIAGLVEVGEVAILSGDGGQGKSLLLQQLMTAAALGKDWLSWPTKRCRTWAMYCEDREPKLHQRQADINRHYGCEHDDLVEDVTWTSRRDQTSFLCSFERFNDTANATRLYDACMRSIEQAGAQLVGFDTTRKTFGGNEINDRQVAGYVRLLSRIAMRMQGAVIVTAHPSNEGVTSGSGLAGSRAWRNEVRSMVYMTHTKGGGNNDRTLHTRKNNYGPPGGKVDIHWQQGVFRLKNEIVPCYEEEDLPFA